MEGLDLRVIESPGNLDKCLVLHFLKNSNQLDWWFVWIEPQWGSISDSRNDNSLVKESEVGWTNARDGVAKDFEPTDDCMTFLSNSVHVVLEGKFTVKVEPQPADRFWWGNCDVFTIKRGDQGWVPIIS